MIFLGKCSSYSLREIVRHTFAVGNSDHVAELRATLAARYGANFDHVAVFHNGRSALAVAIKTLTRRGDKVVITGLTCHAVVQAVRAAGCVPIFADINRETLHFGAPELEQAIAGESDVRALIVQNNLGIPVDIAAIEKVAKKHRLLIIEDLAHCAGVRYSDGREVGTVGRATVLSFGKGKALDTVSGGAVIFPDQHDPAAQQPTTLPSRADRLRDRFYPFLSLITRGLYHIHAKIGAGFTTLLLKIHFIQRAADAPLDNHLTLPAWQAKLAIIRLQALPHRGRPPLREHFFVRDREDCLEKLATVGCFLDDIWYETPVAPARYLENSGFRADLCPVAAVVAPTLINLPTWYQRDLTLVRSIVKKYALDSKADLALEAEKAKKYAAPGDLSVRKSRPSPFKILKKAKALEKAQEEGTDAALGEIELETAKPAEPEEIKSDKPNGVQTVADLAKPTSKWQALKQRTAKPLEKLVLTVKQNSTDGTKDESKSAQKARKSKRRRIASALKENEASLSSLDYLSVLDKKQSSKLNSQKIVAKVSAPILSEEAAEVSDKTEIKTSANSLAVENTQKTSAKTTNSKPKIAKTATKSTISAPKTQKSTKSSAKLTTASGMRQAAKPAEPKPETAGMAGMMKVAARPKTAVELAREARAAGKEIDHVA